MKRFVLLLLLFFNIIPVFENSKFSIGIYDCKADNYGDEYVDNFYEDYIGSLWDDYDVQDFSMDNVDYNDFDYGTEVSESYTSQSDGSITPMTIIGSEYISIPVVSDIIQATDWSLLGYNVNINWTGVNELPEIIITASSADHENINMVYGVLDILFGDVQQQLSQNYSADPVNNPPPPPPPVAISDKSICDNRTMYYNEKKCDSLTCDKNSPCYEPKVCLQWNTCLTLNALEIIFPSNSQAGLNTTLGLIAKYAPDFGLNSPEIMQHFLSQTSAETGFNLGTPEGDLDCPAEKLHTRFKKYFPAQDNSNSIYAHNPILLGNLVYGDLFENGGVSTGNGYKFRGRGLIQLTGKCQYKKFQDFYNSMYHDNIDLLSNPDLLITNHDLDVISSLWFFQTKILNSVAIDANTNVAKVTHLVNGGKNGLNQRIKTFNVAKDNLNCPK